MTQKYKKQFIIIIFNYQFSIINYCTLVSPNNSCPLSGSKS